MYERQFPGREEHPIRRSKAEETMAEPTSYTKASNTAGRQEHESHDSSTAKREESPTREKNLDQTIADSFPASDPPSSDPNPEGGE